MAFYKKEYLIAVYDEHDVLVDVCDNANEFSKRYNKDIDSARSTIGRISSGRRKFFRHGKINLTIVLIPLDPEEIIELTREDGR